MRSGPGRAIAACALGGVLILIAQATVWAQADIPRATGGTEHLVVHGHDVEPALRAIGIALLALSVALLAARGWLRRLAGLAVVAVSGAGIAVAIGSLSGTGPALLQRAFAPTVHSLSNGPNAWWVVALIGAVISLAGGVSAVLSSGAWSGLGRRYEPPSTSADDRPAGDDDAAAWRALDRGEDPTG